MNTKKWIILCLVLSLTVSSLANGTLTASEAEGTGCTELAGARYPEAVCPDESAQYFVESEDHWNWLEEYIEKVDASRQYRGEMDDYYRTIMEKILLSGEGNTVCSPLNTYIAFSLLAEITDGNTRQQVLDMLQVPDIGSLRARVTALWESNYVSTPVLTSLLANSLWLRESTEYNNKTLDRLAQLYYASSFTGDPGSEEMTRTLQDWTDENTGGLLGEYTKDMMLIPETVLAIVSTIYYKAGWNDTFYSGANTPETFHGTDGDTIVEMMHKTDMMNIYRTENFTSVGLRLNDSGSMFFYLPQEGVDVKELASDPELLIAASYGSGERWSCPEVNLSVPKFRISSRTDLLEILKALGVTDVCDSDLADFTPLTEDAKKVSLSSAEHAAMVEIDEDGVTGAAYTELMMTDGASLPEETVDIVFDRPFLFVITGSDGSVLFSGIVRNITEGIS